MSSSFKIYSASAGSGKTYTLAKAYIKLLISSKNPENFRNILAITFTNKAVGEMKTRVIEKLKLFSSKEYDKLNDTMFKDIVDEMDISEKDLEEKSSIILQKILHNYGGFEISTIDGFTHRVIRTFAHDLNIPVNFEVELDQDFLLNKAIDNLINKAGSDNTLTKTLINFAIEKADDDKSWNINDDFYKTGKLLFSENHLPYLDLLKDKPINAFNTLKKHLKTNIASLEQKIVTEAESVLILIDEAGLEHSDFVRKSLPNYFKKIAAKNFNLRFDAVWQTNLVEGNSLTRAKENQNIIDTITAIQPQIAEAFLRIKAWVFSRKLNDAIYKNITPLSILNALQKELSDIKNEENKILISEFNKLISNEIKDQPTPFIYERLGEKFKHYFVDEFQDTSIMQWQNLVPLMDNALSSAGGSAMLVGDAKQSIYRWRGGDAEQFIKLYNGEDKPFSQKVIKENLENNFRSFREIIKFNNSIFKYISRSFFSNRDFAELYKDAEQKEQKNKEGYVNISFLNFENAEESKEKYCVATYKRIKECLDKGYDLRDICVLVRKKKDGIAVSNHLTNKGINIMSSETLLLKNSPKVKLLNDTFTLLINSDEERLKLNVLVGLSEYLNIKNKHTFFQNYLKLNTEDLFSELKVYGIDINYKTLIHSPIYEAAESLVRGFGLCKQKTDAYVQFYLDTILEYSNKESSDISKFLEYFKTKEQTLSISVSENVNAVSIMTIHKSKGLEFPVIIFPFADLDMYKEREAKEWLPLNPDEFLGFQYSLLNFNSDFENYGEVGLSIYNTHRSHLELDAINMLYVTMTRAVEKLYVVSKENISKTDLNEQKSFASLFINYLKQAGDWQDGKTEYEYGINDIKEGDKVDDLISVDYEYISNPKEAHSLKAISKNGILWETEQQEAIIYGNLLHLVMSKIITKNEVDTAILQVSQEGLVNQQDIKALTQIVNSIINHEELKEYFSGDYTIYNEREIITAQGEFYRPDRIAFKNNEVVIIDYKTGNENAQHKIQINKYADVLKSMNYTVKKKLLVYTNNCLNIVEVK